MRLDPSARTALIHQMPGKSGSSRRKATDAATACARARGAIKPQKWVQSCVNLYLNASKALWEGAWTKLLLLKIKMSSDSHFQKGFLQRLGGCYRFKKKFAVEPHWHLPHSRFKVIKTHQISSDGKTSARWWFSFQQGRKSFLFFFFLFLTRVHAQFERAAINHTPPQGPQSRLHFGPIF